MIIRCQSTAENGQIVAEMITNDYETTATLKRFYKENHHYRLHPENCIYGRANDGFEYNEGP